MCRFIMLDVYKDKGKRWVVLYDQTKKFCYVESLRRYRQKYNFYSKHGVIKKEEFDEES